MIVKHWSELASCIGMLEGLSKFNDFEDFNKEGLKKGILEVKAKLEVIFEEERNKLEDLKVSQEG